jgi:hypothetical protein
MKLRSVATFVCGTALAAQTRQAQAQVLPKGNAAWVYDVDYGEANYMIYSISYTIYHVAGTSQAGSSAMWASQIDAFNSLASSSHKISTIYTYGGDMEYYPDDPKNPYQTYVVLTACIHVVEFQ